jgi:hypothetical protein
MRRNREPVSAACSSVRTRNRNIQAEAQAISSSSRPNLGMTRLARTSGILLEATGLAPKCKHTQVLETRALHGEGLAKDVLNQFV